MPPHVNDSASNDGESDIISRIYLIRHGDRFDYAHPLWLEDATNNNCLTTDPPLSELGHRQAAETAKYMKMLCQKEHRSAPANEDFNESQEHIHKILVSPYLRVIQTAVPTSVALGIPLQIETGLSEAHATPNVLPSSKERFAYFPQINTNYTPLLNVSATPGYNCPKTQFPCEAFAGAYVQRLEEFASILERTYYGKSVVLFSHAASVALVAALLRENMKSLKFAPCGIYYLERVDEGPWKLIRNGGSNSEYVKENSPTTYPWGFDDKHFKDNAFFNVDFDYFVQKES